METNHACNCCEIPPATRIAIQFVSFNRSCDTECFVRGGPDWLTGPFDTRGDASGSKTLTYNNTSQDGLRTITSSYNRTTSAFIEVESTLAGGNRGGFEDGFVCPCDHGYDETTSSSFEQIDQRSGFINGTFQTWTDRCYTTCEGGGSLDDCPNNCEEAPVAPAWTVQFGGATAKTITDGCEYGRSGFPGQGESFEDITTFNCENASNCPAPFPFQFQETINPTQITITFSGESAACIFEKDTVEFLDFATVLKLVPSPIFNSGFEQGFVENPPSHQGYLSETFRYARGTGERFKAQSEQHIKWRVVHNPTPTCYLKIWFVKRIQKEKRGTGQAGSVFVLPVEISYEDAGTYEWSRDSKDNNRCAKQAMSVWDKENIVYGEAKFMEIPQPNSQNREWGITEQIFIKKISMIEGYEPPNPPNPIDHPMGLGTQDISVSPLDCIQCESEDWRCSYKFIPELIEDCS